MKHSWKSMLAVAALALLPALAKGQVTWPPPLILTANPNGSCANGVMAVNITANTFWMCTSGGWVQLASGAGSGTLTSFSSGSLSPLFTSSVVNPTSTPALSFSLSNASASTLFGNPSGTSGVPSFAVPSSWSIPTYTGTITTGNCVKWASATSVTDAGAACGSGGSPTLDAVLNPVANKDFNLGTNTLSFTSNGTSNGVNIDTSGNLYPIGTGSIGANKARFGATPIIFNPSIVPTTGQCLDYDGTYISGTTCGSGGTPGGLTTQYQINNAGAFAGAAALANSAATGVGTVIISQAGTGGTDIPAERIIGFPTSPTADKWQVAATGQNPGSQCNTTSCVAWVNASGSWNFSASNFQIGTTGAAPYLYLDDHLGSPAQGYLKYATAALSITTCSASTATTGGTLAAATYWFECTYTNSAGETSFQSAFSVPTTGTTSTITIAAPGASVSASGYHVYYGGTGATQPAQTSFDLVTTLTGVCTAGTADLGGHPTCAPTSNALFTAAPSTSAINPPATNTTGADFIDAWQASGEGVGLCLASSTSSSDCVVGGGVALPGGTGLNLTSGANTTANTLACFSASETASQCAANAANNIVGVFIGGQQNSLVQTTGIVTINLAAAATTTYNHFACTNATAGTIVDSATACASGQQVGLIAQTNASNVTSVPVLLTVSGAGGGGGGSTAWSALTAPSANLSLSMGADTSTFTTTTAVSDFFKWSNTTAATSTVSQNSPVLTLCGQGWEGATPANTTDCDQISYQIPNGANQTSALTINSTTASTIGVVDFNLTSGGSTNVNGLSETSNTTIALQGSSNAQVIAHSGNVFLYAQGGAGNTVKIASGGFEQLVNAIAFSTTPSLDLGLGSIQQFSCTTAGSSVSPTTTHFLAGDVFRVIFVQNGTTACTWTWPSTIHGGGTVSTTLSSVNVQEFVVSNNGTDAYAAGPLQTSTGGTP